MLFVHYFCWVGAGLLALLFVADSQLPRPEARAEEVRNFHIRVAAKPTLPEAITFSGHAASYGPAPALEVVDFAARASQPSSADAGKADVRNAQAQMTPAEVAKPPEKRRPVKRHAKRTIEPQPPRLVEAWGSPSWSPWAPWPRYH